MLNKAGSETTKAKRSFRMPFAAWKYLEVYQNMRENNKFLQLFTLIKRKILPIRKTRTTRNNVGDIGKSIIISSISIPKMDASTSRKSKTFHGTVK